MSRRKIELGERGIPLRPEVLNRQPPACRPLCRPRICRHRFAHNREARDAANGARDRCYLPIPRISDSLSAPDPPSAVSSLCTRVVLSGSLLRTSPFRAYCLVGSNFHIRKRAKRDVDFPPPLAHLPRESSAPRAPPAPARAHAQSRIDALTSLSPSTTLIVPAVRIRRIPRECGPCPDFVSGVCVSVSVEPIDREKMRQARQRLRCEDGTVKTARMTARPSYRSAAMHVRAHSHTRAKKLTITFRHLHPLLLLHRIFVATEVSCESAQPVPRIHTVTPQLSVDDAAPTSMVQMHSARRNRRHLARTANHDSRSHRRFAIM